MATTGTPVPPHRVITARGGKNALAEKANGRDRDATRDELCAARTERLPHDFGSWSAGIRKPCRSKRAKTNPGDQDVDNDHAGDADEKSARQVAPRVAHFAA